MMRTILRWLTPEIEREPITGRPRRDSNRPALWFCVGALGPMTAYVAVEVWRATLAAGTMPSLIVIIGLLVAAGQSILAGVQLWLGENAYVDAERRYQMKMDDIFRRLDTHLSEAERAGDN